MKKTFKSFIIENSNPFSASPMIRPAIEAIDFAEFEKLVKSEYSIAFNAWLRGSTIYRHDSMIFTRGNIVAMEDFLTGEKDLSELENTTIGNLCDSSKSRRHSKSSNNLYQLALDNIEEFKHLASRSRSFIGSTKYETAYGYGGQISILLPKNDAIISGSSLKDFLLNDANFANKYGFSSFGDVSQWLVDNFRDYRCFPGLDASGSSTVTNWDAFKKHFDSFPLNKLLVLLGSGTYYKSPLDMFKYYLAGEDDTAVGKQLLIALLGEKQFKERAEDLFEEYGDSPDRLDADGVVKVDALTIWSYIYMRSFAEAKWDDPAINKFVDYICHKQSKLTNLIKDAYNSDRSTLEELFIEIFQFEPRTNLKSFKPSDGNYRENLSGLDECWIEGRVLAFDSGAKMASTLKRVLAKIQEDKS